MRLKWHKIVHFGTVDQPTWNAIQFTHLLCFAKTKGLLRVGVGAEEDTVVDLGSTMPDILQRGPKPPGLRKAACCAPAANFNFVTGFVGLVNFNEWQAWESAQLRLS